MHLNPRDPRLLLLLLLISVAVVAGCQDSGTYRPVPAANRNRWS